MQNALADHTGRKEAELAVRQWLQMNPLTPLLKVQYLVETFIVETING